MGTKGHSNSSRFGERGNQTGHGRGPESARSFPERLILCADGTTGDAMPYVKVASSLIGLGYEVEVHLSAGYDWLLEAYTVPGAADLAYTQGHIDANFRGQKSIARVTKLVVQNCAEFLYENVLRDQYRRGNRDLVIVSGVTHFLVHPLIQMLAGDRWAIFDPLYFLDSTTGYPTPFVVPYHTGKLASRAVNFGVESLVRMLGGFFKGAAWSVLDEDLRSAPEIAARHKEARFDPSKALFRVYAKTLDGSINEPQEGVVFGPQIVGSAVNGGLGVGSLLAEEEAFFARAAEAGIPVITISFGSMRPRPDKQETLQLIIDAARSAAPVDGQLPEAYIFFANTMDVDCSGVAVPPNLFVSQGFVNLPEVARRSAGMICHGGSGHMGVSSLVEVPATVFYALAEQKHNAQRSGARLIQPMNTLTADELARAIADLVEHGRSEPLPADVVEERMNGHEIIAREIARLVEKRRAALRIA